MAGPDVGVGDGLVGAEGVQRLGEDPELGDVDAELAPAGGDDLALGPDPVADVEGLEHGGGLGDELVVLEEELHVAALVVEGGEAEEALGPDRGQAAGDAHGLAGVGVGGQVGVGGVELAGGGGAVERVGVDVDAGGGQRVDLGQALGPLGGVTVAGGAVVDRRRGGVLGRGVLGRARLALAIPCHVLSRCRPGHQGWHGGTGAPMTVARGFRRIPQHS